WGVRGAPRAPLVAARPGGVAGATRDRVPGGSPHRSLDLALGRSSPPRISARLPAPDRAPSGRGPTPARSRSRGSPRSCTSIQPSPATRTDRGGWHSTRHPFRSTIFETASGPTLRPKVSTVTTGLEITHARE